ncbi:MAG: hypothetical protein FWE67_07995, partial [Planctomycetaceae bacterium]|nr:hypothetical protein [Planctomycetaceae bacterium]
GERGGDESRETYIFNFEKDEKELRQFIRDNFIIGKSDVTKTRIDKNNFINIYNRWLEAVKPTIAVDWELAKKAGIIDGDFYLADLLSRENETLKEKLFVLLRSNHYVLDKKIDVATGFFNSKQADFIDRQKAHAQFWAIYERPPLEEYWDYIIERRDLLVPQDIRERKGSFFTPRVWVELSQQYIADVLGKNWQDEYYVWDCAAGTGNLLAGLTNKYNIWASTIDKADVDVMKDRIDNGANLLEDHVFQFDFLNDDFSKLPQGLQNIINNPNLRKKLIVYINPPYVEGDSRIGKGRKGTQETKIHEKYQSIFGKAGAEISAQFFGRMYLEIPDCIIAAFSKMNFHVAPNYEGFREFFLAKTERMFLIPSMTFDNVNGKFPISFKIWNTSKKERFKRVSADVYDENGRFWCKKKITAYDNSKYISDWLEEHTKNISAHHIGHLASVGNDFQNQTALFIDDVDRKRKKGGRHTMISVENLIVCSIYFAVRKVIPADWLNDRDQFLHPNKKWENDTEFQNDCLAYTLFSNNIQSKYGVNHWIPFLEGEVNARDQFESHFMMSFINGKIIHNGYSDLFAQDAKKFFTRRKFSAEAKAAFTAGKKLWTYYHSQPRCNVNASLYDIREHFQGRNAQGKMNNQSEDETYNELIADLRAALKILAEKIEPKVYEYGFLKR